MDKRTIGWLPLMLLSACAGMAGGTEPAPHADAAVATALCRNDSVQSHLGATATAELGAQLLRESGARVLRWVPPDTMITMDYRDDRLTVHYDRDYRIERILCG